MSNCVAIVLAGGGGIRFGADKPKQFVEVRGKSILRYSIETALGNSNVTEGIVVCPSQFIDYAKESIGCSCCGKPLSYTVGGEEFVDSFRSGLNAANLLDDDIVVIVSGDRPLIEGWEIDDAVESCRKHGSGIASLPAARCALKSFDGVSSIEYLRDQLYVTATPWAFRCGTIRQAMKSYDAGELGDVEPYPPAIYIAAGNEAFMSKASRRNIKITYKEDLTVMERYLDEWESGEHVERH